MKRIILTVATLVAVFAVSAQSASTVIIPRPLEATQAKGAFVVSAKTVIAPAEEALVRPAEIFAEYIASEAGITLAVEKGGKKGIILSIDGALGKEDAIFVGDIEVDMDCGAGACNAPTLFEGLDNE